jgi:galactokinase
MIPAGQAAASFKAAFGAEPQVLAWAPGRINLIGEHIDYAGGCVLPVALELGITAAAAQGSDGRIRVFSDRFVDAGIAEFEPGTLLLNGGSESVAFSNFVHTLAVETGASGLDISISSDLPIERGWSSSAAFAVALASAMLALLPESQRPTSLGLCKLCQKAESDALGVSCGIMDQYASVFGARGFAVYLDTASLTHRLVPLSMADAVLISIDSGQPRRLAGSGYNQRRDEFSRAIAELRAHLGEFSSFRTVAHDKLILQIDHLEPPLRNRMRHIVTEEQRVEQFVRAMQEGNVVDMGQLLSASQHSLSEDYAVSTIELDLLCDLLSGQAGIYGARLVGGGFGGGVLALAHRDVVPQRLELALGAYSGGTDREPAWSIVQSGEGAMVQLTADTEPQLVREWLG